MCGIVKKGLSLWAMRKLLAIAAALLLITAACTKEDTTTAPNNKNTGGNNSGTGKRCKPTEAKSYDSIGNLITLTQYFYTDGFEDSIVITSPSTPNYRTVYKWTYTSKYERRKELIANGTINPVVTLEKINDNGDVIETRSEINGHSNQAKVVTIYTCN